MSDQDPGDEHVDAPVFHYPGTVIDILLAMPPHEIITNEAIGDALRYRSFMEGCCEDCSRELYDDDGA